MDHNIIPTAEPFFFPGGPVGCLLVHGFTGTPKEMRWVDNSGHVIIREPQRELVFQAAGAFIDRVVEKKR